MRPETLRAAVVPGGRVVVFAVGRGRIAVPAEQVVEVAQIEAYTPLPCEDPANVGIVLHRERLIPLVDPTRRLGNPRARPAEGSGLCLFLRTEWGELGCLIDEVVGIETAGDRSQADQAAALDLMGLGGSHGESAAR